MLAVVKCEECQNDISHQPKELSYSVYIQEIQPDQSCPSCGRGNMNSFVNFNSQFFYFCSLTCFKKFANKLKKGKMPLSKITQFSRSTFTATYTPSGQAAITNIK